MYIESKKRSGRNDNLMVFNFTSINDDFCPFVKSMTDQATNFNDPKHAKLWIELINKINNRCDSKYAHDNVVATSTLFADEYALFMELALCLILIKDYQDNNYICAFQDAPAVVQPSPGICPICSCENLLLINDDVESKIRRSFCFMCGSIRDEYYQIDESGMRTINEKNTTESIGAGTIGFRAHNNSDVLIKQVTRYSTQEDVKEQIAEMSKDISVKLVHATWFDEKTNQIVHLI